MDTPRSRRIRLGQPDSVLRRLLIKTEDVSCRVAEASRDLGRIGADGLHDLAAVGEDGVHGCSYAVDHDVDEKAGLCSRRPAGDERAADFSGGVVEGGVAVAALPAFPTEDLQIEVHGSLDIFDGQLEVANLTVRR